MGMGTNSQEMLGSSGKCPWIGPPHTSVLLMSMPFIKSARTNTNKPQGLFSEEASKSGPNPEENKWSRFPGHSSSTSERAYWVPSATLAIRPFLTTKLLRMYMLYTIQFKAYQLRSFDKRPH